MMEEFNTGTFGFKCMGTLQTIFSDYVHMITDQPTTITPTKKRKKETGSVEKQEKKKKKEVSDPAVEACLDKIDLMKKTYPETAMTLEETIAEHNDFSRLVRLVGKKKGHKASFEQALQLVGFRNCLIHGPNVFTSLTVEALFAFLELAVEFVDGIKPDAVIDIQQIFYEAVKNHDKFRKQIDLTTDLSPNQSFSDLPTSSTVTDVKRNLQYVCRVLQPPVSRGTKNSADRMICSGGWKGIVNIGNTCYLNCTVQVLSNTPELRHYFLSEKFREDINLHSPIGTNGNIAKAFSELLTSLWDSSTSAICPSNLKAAMEKKHVQFAGFHQQDAEEFLECLLDGLHEDLNQARDPNFDVKKFAQDKTHDILVNESWLEHLSRNYSQIVQIFHGQFRASLVCPICNCVSITFNPFSVLSAPLPQRKTLSVLFVYRNVNLKPVKYDVNIDTDGKGESINDALYRLTGVNPADIRLYTVVEHRVGLVLSAEVSVQSLDATTEIIGCEILSALECGETVKEILVQQSVVIPLHNVTLCCHCQTVLKTDSILKKCIKCYRVVYCSRLCQVRHWPTHRETCQSERDAVGFPFIISLPVSCCSHQYLKKTMDEYSTHFVSIIQPPDASSSATASVVATNPVKSGPSAKEMGNNPVGSSSLFSLVAGPVSASCNRLKHCDSGNETLDWTALNEVEMVWNNVYSIIVSKEWDSFGEKSASSVGTTGIHECFKKFFEPEVLSTKARYCSKCDLHTFAQMETSFYRLPKVLIVHLKRFKFNNISYRYKLSDLVSFPISSLDVGSYCHRDALLAYGPSGCVYDLYGVVNHNGDIMGGHYTAHARTPSADMNTTDELSWRLFNDGEVHQIDDQSDVVTGSAYVLFYRRRGELTPLHPTAVDAPSVAVSDASQLVV